MNLFRKLMMICGSIFFFQLSFSQQTTIYDSILSITEDDKGFKYFSPELSAGINWISPYDYYNGQFEMRFEILEYTADTVMAFNVCIWSEVENNWQSWKETCCPHVLVSGKGVYTSTSIPENWWKLNDVPVNFSRGDLFEHMGLVLWCDMSRIMSPWIPAETSCWELHKKYLPIKLRLTIVAIAEGYTFFGWDSYLKSLK